MGAKRALTRQQRQIKEMHEQGLAYYEIAESLGKRSDHVAHTFERLNIIIPDSDRQACRLRAVERATKTEAQLNEELRPFGFEYVSGYTGCDSKVRIRCLKCGAEIERYFNFTRKGSGAKCPECARRAAELRQDVKRAAAVQRKELEKIKRSEQIELYFKTCKECGRLFVESGRRSYCSDACAKRRANCHKDRRLNKRNIIDKDITLERLYKRDSGVCYICGKKCDWHDFIVEDGVTICGDNYPSIEHVTPISKGGLHSWDNVRLACRRCNTLKRNNPLPFFYSD